MRDDYLGLPMLVVRWEESELHATAYSYIETEVMDEMAMLEYKCVIICVL